MIHILFMAENEVSLFSSLVLYFLPMKTRKKWLQMESLTLSADLEKLSWNLYGWCSLVQTDKWVIFHLIALISGFRDAQLCCSKSFIKNLWGEKRCLCGPVWFHYLWQSTQMEQSHRRPRMPVHGAGVTQRPLEPPETESRCAGLLGSLTESWLPMYNLLWTSQSSNPRHCSQKTNTHTSLTFNLPT